jgi:hypothetical protein
MKIKKQMGRPPTGRMQEHFWISFHCAESVDFLSKRSGLPPGYVVELAVSVLCQLLVLHPDITQQELVKRINSVLED